MYQSMRTSSPPKVMPAATAAARKHAQRDSAGNPRAENSAHRKGSHRPGCCRFDSGRKAITDRRAPLTGRQHSSRKLPRSIETCNSTACRAASALAAVQPSPARSAQHWPSQSNCQTSPGPRRQAALHTRGSSSSVSRPQPAAAVDPSRCPSWEAKAAPAAQKASAHSTEAQTRQRKGARTSSWKAGAWRWCVVTAASNCRGNFRYA